jgi:hypothetical protein
LFFSAASAAQPSAAGADLSPSPPLLLPGQPFAGEDAGDPPQQPALPSAVEAANTTVGAHVKVQNLHKRPELNGREGDCTNMTDAGRWEVRLDNGETFAFNSDNLEPLQKVEEDNGLLRSGNANRGSGNVHKFTADTVDGPQGPHFSELARAFAALEALEAIA